MHTRFISFSVAFLLVVFNFTFLNAQENNVENENMSKVKLSPEEQKIKFDQLVFFDYRGTNVLEASGGVTQLFDDVTDPEIGYNFKLGYKRSIIDYLFVGVSFNKYTLNYSTIEQDLISFDFNLEVIALPYSRVSPFLFGGFGYNASEDFEVNAVKAQGGVGIEYIAADGIGIKLYGEYNLSMDDETGFLINDMEDDTFFRIGLGINFYFGGFEEREKRLKEIPTQIKSNPILPNN